MGGKPRIKPGFKLVCYLGRTCLPWGFARHRMYALLALLAALFDPAPEPAPPAWRPAPGAQVRIEQSLSIRISPGNPRVPAEMLVELQQEEVPPRFVERKHGKCIATAGIAGVDSASGNRLLLFLRDSRILSGRLDKSCNSRDFYSGFYVERSADGQICVNRDRLQSRTGASCKLKALRELVAVGR